MKQDVFSYQLKYRGKPVGRQTLTEARQGRVTLLGSKLLLQGAFGNATVTQDSRYLEEPGLSLSYNEETQDKGGKRSFQVTFDRENGLIKARKGSDRSELPLMRPYLDPLSLLHRLRRPAGDERFRVPMLGHDVTVERLGEKELTTSLGIRRALVFTLKPGRNAVFVDAEAPHHILMLTQIVDGQQLDAQLVKVDREDAPVPKANGGRKRKSRSRRRRRRRSQKRPS